MFNKVDAVDQVGVVTGLAYTQFGGEHYQLKLHTIKVKVLS